MRDDISFLRGSGSFVTSLITFLDSRTFQLAKYTVSVLKHAGPTTNKKSPGQFVQNKCIFRFF